MDVSDSAVLKMENTSGLLPLPCAHFIVLPYFSCSVITEVDVILSLFIFILIAKSNFFHVRSMDLKCSTTEIKSVMPVKMKPHGSSLILKYITTASTSCVKA